MKLVSIEFEKSFEKQQVSLFIEPSLAFSQLVLLIMVQYLVWIIVFLVIQHSFFIFELKLNNSFFQLVFPFELFDFSNRVSFHLS